MKKLFPSLSNILRPLFIVIALAAFPLNAGYSQLFRPVPKGDVLVYEVDPDSIKDGRQVNMDKLVDAVDTRLNSGPSRIAVVKRIGDRQLEIAMMRKRDVEKQRVEKLLAQSGNLEFRILAHPLHDTDIIKRSLADPSKQTILNDEGKLLAWWVPVKAGEEKAIESYSDIVARKKTNKDRETMEVLVVDDPYNATGAFIDTANINTDPRGRPCVDFALNKQGGRRLGELTGLHLPDESKSKYYHMGIILNDVLYSAPVLRQRIYRHGQITGSFTREQVNDIVLLLKSGSLPYKLRPVVKKTAADGATIKRKNDGGEKIGCLFQFQPPSPPAPSRTAGEGRMLNEATSFHSRGRLCYILKDVLSLNSRHCDYSVWSL